MLNFATHQSIANMVGASREMVSKDLERGGYVEKRDGKLAIVRSLPPSW